MRGALAGEDSSDHADHDDDRDDDDIELGRHAFSDRRLHRLGGNGRACADCHMASDSFQLSPAMAKARFDALQACRAKHPKRRIDDPLFRPIDADDFRTNGDAASDYSNLTQNGLVRVTLPLPSNVKLVDPVTGLVTDEAVVDVWRSVPSINNVAITGPDTSLPSWPRGPNQQGGYQLDARVDTLQNQALGALQNHAQIQNAPPQSLLDDIATFQKAKFSSPGVELLANALAAGTTPLPETEGPLTPLEQEGKAVFTRSCGQCHGGPTTTTPIIPPAPLAPIARYHDIFSECPRPVDTANPPRYVFPACPPSIAKNARTYEIVPTVGPSTPIRRTTSDPGRALLTGYVGGPAPADDWGKFDIAPLHGISKTAPYFVNNSAATLEEVLDLYDALFQRIRVLAPASALINTTAPGQFDRPFTAAERPALLAYLRKL